MIFLVDLICKSRSSGDPVFAAGCDVQLCTNLQGDGNFVEELIKLAQKANVLY
jgi:hypothetical protein